MLPIFTLNVFFLQSKIFLLSLAASGCSSLSHAVDYKVAKKLMVADVYIDLLPITQSIITVYHSNLIITCWSQWESFSQLLSAFYLSGSWSVSQNLYMQCQWKVSMYHIWGRGQLSSSVENNTAVAKDTQSKLILYEKCYSILMLM